MLSLIRTKIRNLVGDFSSAKDFEVFEYSTTSTFTVAQVNITITKVLKNGVALGSGDYDFDSTTNKIEITASLTTGDKIEVDYTFYNYSNTEIDGQIMASLSWISLYSSNDSTDFELEDDEIVPTPDNKTTDLIAIVASMLIKPEFNSYKLPNVTVSYPEKMSREERLEKIINRFKIGIGVSEVIEWNDL